MKINKVTITGADNKTNGFDLLKLQNQYPFVEWGILFSKNKEGQQRYPTLAGINMLFSDELNLSAHFCGWFSREVLENRNYELITQLSSRFKRVQLNFNFRKTKGVHLGYLLDYAVEHLERSIILQYNNGNKPYLDEFMINELPPNIHFLYDGSGGRGVEINQILEPIGKQYTGYSGGLGPENVEEVSRMISEFENESEVWIDMENGVRTDNELDLEKVKSVLNKMSKSITV